MEKTDIDIKQSQNAKLAKPRNLGKKIFKPKGLVVLYGGPNTGKTSTLTELLFELTNTGIMAYFNKHMISTRSKKLQYQEPEYVYPSVPIITADDQLTAAEIKKAIDQIIK